MGIYTNCCCCYSLCCFTQNLPLKVNLVVNTEMAVNFQLPPLIELTIKHTYIRQRCVCRVELVAIVPITVTHGRCLYIVPKGVDESDRLVYLEGSKEGSQQWASIITYLHLKIISMELVYIRTTKLPTIRSFTVPTH